MKRGASKWETLARCVKMASLAFERSRRSRSLSRASYDDGSKRDFKMEDAAVGEGRLGIFGPVLPNFLRKKLISDFLQIFWHRRTKAIGGENHNAS